MHPAPTLARTPTLNLYPDPDPSRSRSPSPNLTPIPDPSPNPNPNPNPNQAWIHDGNIEKLARGVEGTRVVIYAINAIDNKVAEWHTGWTQKAERLGIANMVSQP